jgi:uroporphyrinogen-III decarboxylase
MERGQQTPSERRAKRLEQWKNMEGFQFLSPEAEQLYKTRAQRHIDAFNVTEPDRVPVFLNTGSLPAYLYGYDYRTVSYDYGKLAEVFNRFNEEHAADLETFSIPFLMAPGKVLDVLDYRLYNWPGHGLPNESRGYQFVEKEYMMADEYEAFIRDPSDFWLRTFLPRISGALEPFKMMKPLMQCVEFGSTDLMSLSMPAMQEALQALMDAGKEYGKFMQVVLPMVMKAFASGYPMFTGAFGKAPFDILADTLRGTKGIMMDMFRRPEKLLAAIERITDMTIGPLIASTNAFRSISVLFPLHKGADGWMNEKQFETFYWPSLKKICDALIGEGIMPLLFAEGSYTSRLDLVDQFPKGSVMWWFDQTDMVKAKATVGRNCCISGNVPSSLLVTGRPEQVKEVCRTLIGNVGEGGGFILSAGAFSDEAKLENLKAMAEATREYGVYR